jgi:hypothetical protein
LKLIAERPPFVPLSRACDALGVSRAVLYPDPRKQRKQVRDRRRGRRRDLSAAEREQVLAADARAPLLRSGAAPDPRHAHERVSAVSEGGDSRIPVDRYREVVWVDDVPVAFVVFRGTLPDVYFIHSDHLNTPRALTRAHEIGGSAVGALAWEWPLTGDV